MAYLENMIRRGGWRETCFKKSCHFSFSTQKTVSKSGHIKKPKLNMKDLDWKKLNYVLGIELEFIQFEDLYIYWLHINSSFRVYLCSLIRWNQGLCVMSLESHLWLQIRLYDSWFFVLFQLTKPITQGTGYIVLTTIQR